MKMLDPIKKEFVEKSYAKDVVVVLESGRATYEAPKLKPVKEPVYEIRP